MPVVGAAKEKRSSAQGSTDPGVDQIDDLKNHATLPQDNLISLISHEHSSHKTVVVDGKYLFKKGWL